MTEKFVFCVDDNKQIRDVIAQLMHPFRVVSAKDIAEALEIAAAQKFDLFIIDIYLPDGVGPDLLSKLRKDHPETPAIFITTAPDFSMEEIHEFGVIGLLRKGGSNFVSDLLGLSRAVLGT